LKIVRLYISFLMVTIFCALPETSADEVASDEFAQLEVIDAYIELRTGPGRGFPVYYVAEQGEWVEILKSKTRWYKVRLTNQKMGWVIKNQLKKTLTVDGEEVLLDDPDYQEYLERLGEVGVLTGDFEGASLISIYGGYHFTKNLSTELSLSQALGNFSEIRMATINVINEPFPELQPLSWLSDVVPYVDEVRMSPYFGIGVGVMETLPRATLVQTIDRTDNLTFVTSGLKFYLTRRFLLRLEYRKFVVLTDRNENEDVEEWKLGFSIFF